jgi:hypothetical protein
VTLVRYLADGALDPGFGTAGIATFTFSGPIASPAAIARQSDGKLVVAGSAAKAGVATDGALVRVMP